MARSGVEADVLYLLLILLLTWLVLMALLWAGTVAVQGMLYEGIPEGMHWRAPAAGGAVAAFFAVWCLLNYAAREPGRAELPYDSLFNLTGERVGAYEPSFTAEREDGPVRYARRAVGGALVRYEYRDVTGTRWQGPRERGVKALVVGEGAKEARFVFDSSQGVYVEEGGRRYVNPNSPGQVMTPRPGGVVFGVVLNVLHFVAWFACLWLLLRFQWPHALGLALALWVTMTIVAPYLLAQTPQKPTPMPAATAYAPAAAVTASCRA